MAEPDVMVKLREALVNALDARRELVAFSRLEAIEMDRRARDVEREALSAVRGLLPAIPGDPRLQQMKMRLQRMDEQLDALSSREGIADRSRMLEQDDITWRAFEDLTALLDLG